MKLEKGPKKRGIKANFYRVVRTELALQECPRDDDRQVYDQGSKRTMTCLGRHSLEMCLTNQAKDKSGVQGRTFHWGNIVYETDVENIVSISGWLNEVWSSNADESQKLKQKLADFTKRRLPLPDIDIVYCGQPFDEADLV